jgi:nucleoside-diphosphate-sugar epimerase
MLKGRTMRALVTGGAGFIGSSIARELLAQGAEVAVFDNLSTGFIEMIPEGARLIQGDLRNVDEIGAACENVDVIFHQAAIRSVPKSVDDPGLTNDSNITGTLNVLRGATAANVKRVVYASSSSAYGDAHALPLTEDLTPGPLSPYAVSKLSGELYCKVWAKTFGLSTVSLRYFNVFGPGQHPDSKYSAVFPGFISALVKGEAPELHWDGEQSRDFTFIGDVVRANLAAAQLDREVHGETFNIGSGSPKTVNEVLRAVSSVLGVWIEPNRLPRRSGDVRHTHASIDKARSLLGWKPQAEWGSAVEATVGWFTEPKQAVVPAGEPVGAARLG